MSEFNEKETAVTEENAVGSPAENTSPDGGEAAADMSGEASGAPDMNNASGETKGEPAVSCVPGEAVSAAETGEQSGLFGEKRFYQGGCDQAGFNQPGNIQQGYTQPIYGQPGNVQQGYNQQVYSQPGNVQQGYNQQVYGRPGNVQQGYNQPGYGQSGNVQQGYNQPIYGQPNYSRSYYNQPAYGQPVYPCTPPQRTPAIAAMPEKSEEKKPSKALIITIVVLILAMFSAVMIILAMNHSKEEGGSISAPRAEDSAADRDRPSGSGVVVNINVQSKPSDDPGDYQDIENGLYTTTGVAKHIAPSIVSLYGYTTTTLTPYASATGVIISEDGYILTNAHMVEGLSRIKAVTNEGDEYEADIIGYEPRCDLAVIQIHADGLVPAELGSSSELLQGEQVVAIGNSGGYENTLTVGYVSYVSREIESYAGYPIECIQTDAAFNTGISGGALVNMYGQVVGIPTSKSIAENDENLGFAIAMDFAAPLCEDIIEKGYVSGKPRVGVQYRLIDYDTAYAIGVKPGMLIAEISEDCDISNTELQIDDIITEMDGIEMTSDEALRRFQSIHKAGDVVIAKVYRRTITNEESEFEITFRLEEQVS